MNCHPVTAVESPRHTIHLQHIDRLPLALGGDRLNQPSHLGLTEDPLQGAADRGQGEHSFSHWIASGDKPAACSLQRR